MFAFIVLGFISSVASQTCEWEECLQTDQFYLKSRILCQGM